MATIIARLASLFRPSVLRRLWSAWHWRRALYHTPLTRRSPEQLRELSPVAINGADPRQRVIWMRLPADAPHDPFYAQTVERAWQASGRGGVIATSFGDLEQLAATYGGMMPSGFVFHTSRCGSTALGNMLAAVPRHAVLSEPNPVNTVLRGSEPDRERRLRSLITVLASSRPDASRVFFKLTSWNTLRIGVFRDTFPRVPWVFIYRDPVEVLVSNLRNPSPWLTPRARRDPFFAANGDIERTEAMPDTEYGAHMLGRFYAEVLEQRYGPRLLVNATELRDAALCHRLAAFFGWAASSEDVASMMAALRWAAKDREQARPHQDDSAQKQQEAGAEVCAAVQKHAAPFYERLEQMRQAQLAGDRREPAGVRAVGGNR